MKKRYVVVTGIVICLGLLYVSVFGGKNLNQVYAQKSGVRYSYDSLGRVSSAIYPDGTEIKFEYDVKQHFIPKTNSIFFLNHFFCFFKFILGKHLIISLNCIYKSKIYPVAIYR